MFAAVIKDATTIKLLKPAIKIPVHSKGTSIYYMQSRFYMKYLPYFSTDLQPQFTICDVTDDFTFYIKIFKYILPTIIKIKQTFDYA